MNPFARKRSLTPRGDPLTARPLEPAEVPSDQPTFTNWPLVMKLWVGRRGAQLIGRVVGSPSVEPLQLPRSPEDPSAIRLGPGNVEVIAGQRIPDPPIVPKPEAERCSICHHPVGHAQDCPTWGQVFGIGDWPSDY